MTRDLGRAAKDLHTSHIININITVMYVLLLNITVRVIIIVIL